MDQQLYDFSRIKVACISQSPCVIDIDLDRSLLYFASGAVRVSLTFVMVEFVMVGFVMVEGDADLLFLLVHNPIVNALKFSTVGYTFDVRSHVGQGTVYAVRLPTR